LTSISFIIDNPHLDDTQSPEQGKLPFVNFKCRSQIRIIDFYPSDLQDFAHSVHDRDYNDGSSSSSSDESENVSMDEDKGHKGRWEWAFYLWVEDAKKLSGVKDPPRLPLLVAGEDAECLLKMDATE
jgi:protection of telomeres protein 1